MLKIILTVTTLLFTIYLHAQKHDLYSTYSSVYAGRDYEINIIYTDTNNYKLEIDLMTYDNRYSKGGLVVTSKNLPVFIKALDTAKIYFNKWEAHARAQKGSKRIIKYFQDEKIGGYFYDRNKSRIDYPLNAKYKYRVLRHNNEIIYVLNISTGNLRAQYGQQYTVHSFSLFFQSEEEIKDFRNLITPEKVVAFIKEND